MNAVSHFPDFESTIKQPLSPEIINTYRTNCPVSAALTKLQGKWKIHILFEIFRADIVRFGFLKRAIPEITNTMLTTSLRELESDGFIDRKQFNEVPPRVEYSLTLKGKDLAPVFFEIYKWGLKHKP